MNYVTRGEWGARAPRCISDIRHVDTVVVHYSASDADEQANHVNCAGRVRGIQRFHMDTRGWCDIAYNFLVCKHGYVYEGRGFYNRSAATGNDNNHTLAVCFLGDDTPNRDDVTALGRQAIVQITRAIQTRWSRTMAYKGHRDFMSTSCPGDELYRYVHSAQFDSAVNDTRLPGPTPKPQWFWTWLDWKLRGSPKPRPEGPPRLIPLWAWQALREWQRRHP